MYELQGNKRTPLSVFISYAHEDEPLRQRLETHLSLLLRQGLISEWHDREILPGAEWAHEIDEHLETASIILLLISPDFLASDYCYDIEMQRALERHQRGEARVIPIILRPVDWRGAPFEHLQGLPRDGKPVTEWNNQDAAFRAIAQSLRRSVEQLAGSARFVPRLSPIDLQNRVRLLKRVHVFWIEGVLEQSLYKAAFIALGFEGQPDALANPWHLVVQESIQAPRPVPPSTRITEIYDQTDGELLILGEPGAGKTTLLLELARNLLTRAGQDDTLPMPVVFNLSVWAGKRQPLADWLVEELHVKYQVPRKLGRTWVIQERLLPLLDGLDEVKEGALPACIAAINTYHTQYPNVSLVVCSRTMEYFAQRQRVAFLHAITIQSLTPQQIDAFLTSAVGQLESVHVALRTNPALHEMVTTPLMLSVLTLAYQGRSVGDLSRTDAHEVQKHLFAAYVERMLTRRGSDRSFSDQQKTIQRLSWLARQMAWHSQTIFFIERLQPSWLPSRLTRLIYRVFVGLLTVLFCMVFGSLVGLVIGLVNGLLLEPTVGPLFRLLEQPASGLVGGLVAGLAIMLVGELNTEIKPTESVSWSWKKAKGGLNIVLVLSLVLGLVLLLFYVKYNPTSTQSDWLSMLGNILADWVVTIFIVLPFLLPFLLPFGFSRNLVEKNIFVKPNEGIWHSARNGILYGTFLGLFACLYTMLIYTLFDQLLSQPHIRLLTSLSHGLYIGLYLGFVIGLLNGLLVGGVACIQHFVLRLLLWRRGAIPWNFGQFLDYASEHILLRKVGSGYIFIHRLLLDYFASLEKKES